MNQGKTSRPSVSRHVWRLAWPSILSNLLFSTIGFAHIKIVTSLGPTAVAAVSSAHRIFFLMLAILLGLSIGTTALVSRNWGAGKAMRAQQVAWNSLITSWALGGLVMLPTLFLPDHIAAVFGLEEEAARQTAQLVFWLGAFVLFSATSMILYSCLRATGDVITPLWFLAASTALNITLSYLTTHGVGPFPALGVEGVGLGGGLGASSITLIFFLVWLSHRFRLKPPTVKFIDFGVVRQLLQVGLPAVLEQGLVQIAQLAFFVIIAGYGTAAYASLGIGVSLVSFSVLIGFGFGVATTTLVGQQLGAGRPDRAMRAARRSLRMAMVTMIALSILLSLTARQLAGFMTSDPATLELTVLLIYLICVAHPFMALDITLSAAFRGAGDTRYPLMVTFCGIIFGRLLPAWLAAKAQLPVQWVVSALVFDYLIKSILYYFKFNTGSWLHTNIDPEPASKGQT